MGDSFPSKHQAQRWVVLSSLDTSTRAELLLPRVRYVKGPENALLDLVKTRAGIGSPA